MIIWPLPSMMNRSTRMCLVAEEVESGSLPRYYSRKQQPTGHNPLMHSWLEMNFHPQPTFTQKLLLELVIPFSRTWRSANWELRWRHLRNPRSSLCIPHTWRTKIGNPAVLWTNHLVHLITLTRLHITRSVLVIFQLREHGYRNTSWCEPDIKLYCMYVFMYT